MTQAKNKKIYQYYKPIPTNQYYKMTNIQNVVLAPSSQLPAKYQQLATQPSNSQGTTPNFPKPPFAPMSQQRSTSKQYDPVDNWHVTRERPGNYQLTPYELKCKTKGT